MRMAVLIAVALLTTGPALATDAVQAGKKIYEQGCIVCHGANGKGAIPGVPDLTRKDGPLSKTDDVLVKHALEGFQSPASPLAMPPKGGNPNLTPEQIRQVVSYLHSAFGH
jgi:cytochrome c5